MFAAACEFQCRQPTYRLATRLVQDGCTPRVYNGLDGKIVSGDGVSDTPAHDIPTQEVYPGADVCWIFDPPLDTCKDLSTGADYGPDPVKNYM